MSVSLAARTVTVGTLVLFPGATRPLPYLGTDGDTVRLRAGVVSGLVAPMHLVAPAAEITVDVKAPGVAAVKAGRLSYAPWVSSYLGTITGEHRTKADALLAAGTAAAVAAWHAAAPACTDDSECGCEDCDAARAELAALRVEDSDPFGFELVACLNCYARNLAAAGAEADTCPACGHAGALVWEEDAHLFPVLAAPNAAAS